MYNFKPLGQHISIKLGMEVEADMRNQKMVINKEKCILGGIMAVALLSVGIGLASVLSDSKSNSYNKENVIDLNELNLIAGGQIGALCRCKYFSDGKKHIGAENDQQNRYEKVSKRLDRVGGENRDRVSPAQHQDPARRQQRTSFWLPLSGV